MCLNLFSMFGAKVRIIKLRKLILNFFFLQSTDLSTPEISLPLVESVENEIFTITQEFVQQRFLGISFHAYIEIRHRGARTRIKNFIVTKIRECRIRRTVKKKKHIGKQGIANRM